MLTVLICSTSRSKSLANTLDSLFCPSNRDVANWEAVVVMRKEDGEGLTVAKRFAAQYPDRFRLLIQPGTGKSEALNVGIAQARGDLLAMTDDDVLCAPDYIASIKKVFEQTPADAAQGRVFLDFESRQPEWMSARHLVFMSSCDYGDEVQQPFNHTLFGTNMIVRTEAARAIGGFSLELGAGSPVGFAEDTEFSIRLRNRGYRFIYAPQIVVRHQLPHKRLTPEFFRKRYFDLGRSHAYYDPPFQKPRWRWGAWIVKNWIMREAEAFRLRANGRPAEALDSQCEAREQAGFFVQHFRFFLGQPRRLSRVTSWSNQAPAPDLQSPKNDDSKQVPQTIRG